MLTSEGGPAYATEHVSLLDAKPLRTQLTNMRRLQRPSQLAFIQFHRLGKILACILKPIMTCAPILVRGRQERSPPADPQV